MRLRVNIIRKKNHNNKNHTSILLSVLNTHTHSQKSTECEAKKKLACNNVQKKNLYKIKSG